MAPQELIQSFNAFMVNAGPILNINDEESYNLALETLENILESANDTQDEPLNFLIDAISLAIEKYESQDEDLIAFVNEAENIPADIAMIRTLMKNYNLTGSDLPEIGGKAMVSRVLNGERELSRSAIEKLSARFGLRPAMFF